MKKWYYLLLTVYFLLTVLFILFDFELNILFNILFYIIYFFISAFLIFETVKKDKGKSVLFGILIILSVINCFTESFLMGLPILSLSFISRRKIKLSLKVISIIISILLIFSYLLSYVVSITTATQEKSRISNGNISIVTLSIDSGAMGLDYIYRVEYTIIDGYFTINKRLCLSNKQLDVYWNGDNYCYIGDQRFKVKYY